MGRIVEIAHPTIDWRTVQKYVPRDRSLPADVLKHSESPLLTRYSREKCLSILPPETEALEAMASAAAGKDVQIDPFLLNYRVLQQWSVAYHASKLRDQIRVFESRVRTINHLAVRPDQDDKIYRQAMAQIHFREFMYYLELLQSRGSQIADVMSHIQIAVFEDSNFEQALNMIHNGELVSLRSTPKIEAPQDAFDLKQFPVVLPVHLNGLTTTGTRSYVNLVDRGGKDRYAHPVGYMNGVDASPGNVQIVRFVTI